MALPEDALSGLVARALATLPARRRLVIGVSGGVDSLLLLALAREQASLPLLAVHVRHDLQPQAAAWAAQVQATCAALEVPCTVLPVAVARDVPSREAAARAARHAAFASVLQPGDALLLAHHADDQAETLLLRLLRGAGLSGLAAMRPVRPLPVADTCLLRPLLGLPRAVIVAAARARGLAWIEDPSNADTAIDRNFLRHEVLPRLAGRWPATVPVLAATAARLAEADALLNDYLDADLAPLLAIDPQAGLALAVDGLLAQPPARRRALLRRWLARRGAPLFSAAWLEQALAIAAARADAEGVLRVGGWELHRYRGRLLAFPARPLPDRDAVLAWDGHSPLPLGPGLGTLLAGIPAAGAPGLLLALPAARAPLTVRFRRGGERIRPAGGVGSRPLKKLLQETAVPPWQRACLPLLYVGDRLAAVGDRLADAAYTPGPDRPATLRLQLAPPAGQAARG